jgi:hypothetical protein
VQDSRDRIVRKSTRKSDQQGAHANFVRPMEKQFAGGQRVDSVRKQEIRRDEQPHRRPRPFELQLAKSGQPCSDGRVHQHQPAHESAVAHAKRTGQIQHVRHRARTQSHPSFEQIHGLLPRCSRPAKSK